jgi:iron uptake system component EfeO
MRMYRLIALTAAGLIAVTGCSGGNGGSSEKIAVTATDDSCEIAKTELKAGSHTFAVKNEGKQVTEFYVYKGTKVVSEVEDIAPGTSRTMTVELAAGTYEGACKPGMKGDGIRTKITVTGKSAAKADPKLDKAVADYRAYVSDEADQLVAKTELFVKAIKAGKAAEAKKLFPRARTHWERIEPVAEIFGDLDPAIDARENDVEPGADFTGFHKLEKDLWVTKDISKSGKVADKLLVDVKKIVEEAKEEPLKPFQLANGSKELLDEVATTKITGEEDRYSHTDLWDFKANVEGSKAAIDALRQVIADRDPKLLKRLDAEFEAVEKTLGRHRDGSGWKPHTALSKTELKQLSDAVNALAEPVSQVAAVVSKS